MLLTYMSLSAERGFLQLANEIASPTVFALGQALLQKPYDAYPSVLDNINIFSTCKPPMICTAIELFADVS